MNKATNHTTDAKDAGGQSYADAQPEARIVGELSPEQNSATRARQTARAKVTGVILIALCILFFAITIVKIGVWG